MATTHARSVVACILLLATIAMAAAPITEYHASDERYFTWLGRYVANKTGAVVFDVEGTSVSFVVANATYVGCTIEDLSLGGARFGSWMDTNISGQDSDIDMRDPNPSGHAMPNIRTAVFLTSRHQTLYTMGSGGQINKLTIKYTLQLLSEWEMIDDGWETQLAVVSFLTDGVLLPAPARPKRRLVVLGDSLSSGVGAGFNVPASGAACGYGVPQDDVSTTWGSLLCASFGAECEIVAGSGITIAADTNYNLPMVFP